MTHKETPQNPFATTVVAVGDVRVASAPAVLSARGAKSCFVLTLYDPELKIGGLTHLKNPTSSGGILGHYALVAIRRLLAEMRGAGASKNRLKARVIAAPPVSSSALRTIKATLRWQGVKEATVEASGGPDRLIQFSLQDGRIIIRDMAPLSDTQEIKKVAIALGSQLLDLRLFREEIESRGSTLPLERLLRQIADGASQMLHGAQCFVAVPDEVSGELRVQTASGIAPWGLERLRFPVGRGIIGTVFAEAKPLLSHKVCPEDWPFASQSQAPSMIAAPLGNGGSPLGVLFAVSSSSADVFGQEELQLLQIFAYQAAIALKNIQFYQQLRAKAKEMEAILQSIGDGIIVTDPQLRLVMANPAAERLLGLDGRLGHERTLPPDSPLAQLLQDDIREGLYTREITINGRSDRQKIICQATVSRIVNAQGHFQGIVAVLRDITAQREMERLKSNLLTVVSHELKTPLHSIRGFVDIILMGKTGELNELQRDFLNTVKQQAAQLQHIINDLLEFTRLEYGPIKLTTEPVRLQEIVQSVFRSFALMAEEKRIALIHAIPEELPPIEGDSVRLEQVITNLVDNALKFTPAGGSIQVGAADLGQEVELWVADTGIGIPLEEQGRIFTKFYQLAAGVQTERRGAGLGLAICKHIVEQHQGRIWVESEPGQGSVFRLILPKNQRRGEELVLDFRLDSDDLSAENLSLATLRSPTTVA